MKLTHTKRNGHERYRFFRKNNGPQATERRRSALQRLEAQLVSGTKPDEKGNLIPLTEGDRIRIKNEITILTQKLSIT